ncbi:MAG: hypothetical protein EBT71_01455 [Alphaproteobacteria bacterium]|nr:hypothetical protein [Alphaproteobacteria bacterium]
MEINRNNGYALAPNALVYWFGLTVLASIYLAYTIFSAPLEQDSWLLWTRYTARLAFFFFLVCYAAGPLYSLHDNIATRWLRRNRRNAGISFGFAHMVHLLAISGFIAASGKAQPLAVLILGGFGYIILLAMILTSFDPMIRLMGMRRWGLLHRFGIHYLAAIFAIIYTTGIFAPLPQNAKPPIFSVLIWSVILLRLGLWVFERRRDREATNEQSKSVRQ